jgi:hypothetical protein
MLDVIPLLVPVTAMFLASFPFTPLAKAVAALALAWSVTVAALGAFCYPNERWNTDPSDVDRNHQRLWDWSDLQILRCWERGPSPANFGLFDRAAFRAPAGSRSGDGS